MSAPQKSLVERAREAGWDNALVINPRTGNLQLHWAHNDVFRAVESAGGVEVVARKLGVEEIEVEHFIDDHRVPERYVEDLCGLSGFEEWSLETPPFDTTGPVHYRRST